MTLNPVEHSHRRRRCHHLCLVLTVSACPRLRRRPVRCSVVPATEIKLAFHMAKSAKNRRTLWSRQLRSTTYAAPLTVEYKRGRTLALERKDYEAATCSVCMELPHNAVLLLCSSYDNGCRPYMCATSYLHSNCLDQFSKACSKVRYTVDLSTLAGTVWPSGDIPQVSELACPLCRGQVKGWTVVESARKHLNNNKRNCMQDDCSFVGTYEELEEHVKFEHPNAKPREIDPMMEEKWRMLELESEQQDAISAITISMPRSAVFGDHVIELADGDEAGEAGGFGEMTNGGILYILQEGARLARLPSVSGPGLPIDGIDVTANISSAYYPADGSRGGVSNFRGLRRYGRRCRRRGVHRRSVQTEN